MLFHFKFKPRLHDYIFREENAEIRAGEEKQLIYQSSSYCDRKSRQ